MILRKIKLNTAHYEKLLGIFLRADTQHLTLAAVKLNKSTKIAIESKET